MTAGATEGLAIDIEVDRPGFRLELAIAVPPGAVTAVVGPNGAGKTTTLRTVAGLLRPTYGHVVLNGRVLDDAHDGRHLDPAKRGIGVVFQDYLLFPHLTALENVAFGLLVGGLDRRMSRERASAWLERLGIGHLSDSRPAALSGGQAQRVALARALVLEPPLLLLDEPLSALDAESRASVRTDLVEELRAFGGATLVVTHDPVDAMMLGDELVVLDNGRLVQRGTPTEVSTAPANDYVAGLFAQ